MISAWIVLVFVIGLWHGTSKASLCTERGRFPNEIVSDCRGYTMCLSGAPGVYLQYDLSCPENFIYSHIDNQCTNITSYQCYPQHKCISTGNFTDETDRNCTKYIACINGLNETATARLVECPESTLFSPLDGVCVNSTQFACETPKSDDSNSINHAINLCSKYVLLVYVIFCLVK